MGRGARLAVGMLAVVLTAAPAASYYSSTWYEGADGHAQAVKQQRALHVPMLVYDGTVSRLDHRGPVDRFLAQFPAR